jgi:O-acetyl-ADP-ribose deacetylase (regulator of RNase III)
VEELVREAIGGLDGGELAVAAEYTFGLAPGTRGWSIGERRRRAAQTYGVSTERFRKHQENLVVAQVAEEILKLCSLRGQVAAPAAPSAEPFRHGHSTLTLTLPAGGAVRSLTFHVMPVELIRGIDVIVSSENVGLEMSKLYRTTVSAALRRAGARRNTAGEIVDDTIQRELAEWVRQHGHIGLSVAAGTVVATGSGALATEQVRRIYHAAVAVPRPDTNDYSVSADTVAIAIRNVFRLAAQERGRYEPPLTSICFPLFGAGQGGVNAATSFSWIWAALDQELQRDDPWQLHLVTHSAEQAEKVVAVIAANSRTSSGHRAAKPAHEPPR